MREALWLYLRNCGLGRRLRSQEKIARPLHAIACRFLPKTCQVKSGPCRGLLLEPSPSWPTDLWAGTYELEVQEVLARLLVPGAVLYDVGSGVGLYSLLGARKGAQVFAFEPHPDNRGQIAIHARINALEEFIHVLPMAASSYSGRLALELAQHESQMAPRGGGDVSRGVVEVTCITLDEFAHSHPAPSVVKLDVEGGESDVLRGAQELFDRVRPRLVCEVHDPENANFVTTWLTQRRYSVHWLGQSGSEHHLLAEPIYGARD